MPTETDNVRLTLDCMKHWQDYSASSEPCIRVQPHLVDPLSVLLMSMTNVSSKYKDKDTVSGKLKCTMVYYRSRVARNTLVAWQNLAIVEPNLLIHRDITMDRQLYKAVLDVMEKDIAQREQECHPA